jgi:Holliday junction resolvase-like predicted endonuclease
MTTTIGRTAENAAVDYLKSKGYDIVHQNWRTRRCEIDIVARRANIIYFCEVKYRRNESQGTGLEYITSKKLAQMHFAAENWLYENSWSGACQLCAIEVAGDDFGAVRLISQIDYDL